MKNGSFIIMFNAVISVLVAEISLIINRDGLNPKGIMLIAWSDFQENIPNEHLHNNQTISSNINFVVRKQLWIKKTTKKIPYLVNRNELILHHDSPRPLTAQLTKTPKGELEKKTSSSIPFCLCSIRMITCLVDKRIICMVLGWHHEKFEYKLVS